MRGITFKGGAFILEGPELVHSQLAVTSRAEALGVCLPRAPLRLLA
jgi:hypothetical protein